MGNVRMDRALWLLFLGDLLTLLAVTVVGFASHSELNAGARMLTTFLPLTVAWMMVGPFLGVYNLTQQREVRNLWRPFYAMILAGPLAAWLRALILGSAIIPVFVAVLTGITALGILTWRLIYLMLWGRRVAIDG